MVDGQKLTKTLNIFWSPEEILQVDICCLNFRVWIFQYQHENALFAENVECECFIELNVVELKTQICIVFRSDCLYFLKNMCIWFLQYLLKC